MRSFLFTKTALLGLAANTVGVIVVAASETATIAQYMIVSGIALATIGMALMYVSRFQKFTQ